MSAVCFRIFLRMESRGKKVDEIHIETFLLKYFCVYAILEGIRVQGHVIELAVHTIIHLALQSKTI